MICFYCEQINAVDSFYEPLDAEFNLETLRPRCARHWRFRCMVCGRFQHFAALAWCEEEELLICRSCSPGERLVREQFWCYSYYTILTTSGGCEYQTLERMEFESGLTGNLIDGVQMGPEEYCYDEVHRVYQEIDGCNIDERELIDTWNANAQAWNRDYDKLGDPLRRYAAPFFLLKSLLEPIENKAILDAGCGSGYLSCLLAKEGAFVTGLDFSRSQLDFAARNAKRQNLEISFLEGTLADMYQFSEQTFDAVVCVTVLSNVPDIESIISEISRVLRIGGHFLLVEIHPCFSMMGFGKVLDVWDSQRFDDVLYWKVDNYYRLAAVQVQYSSFPVPTTTFRHTLSDYINAMGHVGLLVDALYEPFPARSEIDNSPKALGERDQRIPRFVIARAVKGGSS